MLTVSTLQEGDPLLTNKDCCPTKAGFTFYKSHLFQRLSGQRKDVPTLMQVSQVTSLLQAEKGKVSVNSMKVK